MKKVKPPKLVTVAVFTTITIIFWIFFSVYNVLTSEAEIDVDPELLRPIDTSINTQVLNQLPNKRFYESSYVEGANVFSELVDTVNIESENPEEITPQELTEDDSETEEIDEGTDEEETSEPITNPEETSTP